MAEEYKYGRCVTHHYACDCREKQFEDAIRVHNEMLEFISGTNRQNKKKYGEMTAHEISVVRSVILAMTVVGTSTKPKRIDA